MFFENKKIVEYFRPLIDRVFEMIIFEYKRAYKTSEKIKPELIFGSWVFKQENFSMYVSLNNNDIEI